jgi:pilus assembly protein CpaE
MITKDTLDNSPHERSSEGGPLSLVSICLDSESHDLLRQFVESVPGLHLRAQLDDYTLEGQDPVLQWSGDSAPDICLIDFDRDRRGATEAAERIRAGLAGTAIFAVSSDVRPNLIIEAMRCGCCEYIIKPVDRDHLLNAVARVSGQRRERREQYNAQINAPINAPINGQVMAFTGAKGGSGVTTLATHLGALLAKSYSRKTLLVDLHPDGGDAALYLGKTKHRYHFFELLENTHRLDGEFLQSFLIRHRSGLDLLPAPEASEPVKHVAPDVLGQTFDFLRLRYEFILVDLPPGCGGTNFEMIKYSDQIYLVTVAEVPSVRNAARCLDYLSREEHLEERIRVVLNRHLKSAPITDDQIEKAIRRSIFWKVPNQYAEVVAAIMAGDPSAGPDKSEIARNLMRWAGAICGKPDTSGEKKGGFLGLWRW